MQFLYFFLNQDTSTTTPAGNNNMLIIILAVLMIAFFAFSILPQRRKQKKMVEMSSRIKIGDKIKTAGGIFGEIIAENSEAGTYVIKSGDTTFEIDRGFVYSMEMLGFNPDGTRPNAAGAKTAEQSEQEPTEQPQEDVFEQSEQPEDSPEGEISPEGKDNSEA